MFETKAKLASVDPVWARVRQEAYDMVQAEPLLGGACSFQSVAPRQSGTRFGIPLFDEACVGRNVRTNLA